MNRDGGVLMDSQFLTLNVIYELFFWLSRCIHSILSRTIIISPITTIVVICIRTVYNYTCDTWSGLMYTCVFRWL